jgi:type I restriction enzyme S subunit
MEETGGIGMVNSNLAYKTVITSEPEVIVNESPLKWCSVSLSDVVSRGKRLEASVFDVEAKQARSLIAHGKYPTTTVGGDKGLTTSYVCGRFKRIWVEKSDMPIYQPSTIVDIKPTPDGYISKRTKTNIEALRVHKGQVLMTCSGTIGKVSYVSKTLNEKIFSHDLLRITCNNGDDAGYIYTYLKSKIGNKILLTNSYGAVITHIEPEHLATVPIPDAPAEIKKRINDLIVHSYELRDESNEMIDKATDLLIEELHLPDINAFDVNFYKKNAPVDTFSVKLSDLKGRLDASYHVPIVDAITAHLQKYAEEVTTIGDKRISKDVILPGRFKRVYVDEGYGRVLIGGKQLHELDPSGKKYLSSKKHDKLLGKLEVHEGTTLITRSGTIGKVVLVPKHWEHWVPSDHIIRVVPADKNIAGYLNIFLASDYGKAIITRFTYGSVVDEIDDNHVRQIAVPLLKNREIQKQINNLALEANEKRYQAYKLEQEALYMMDKEVIYAK